MPHTLEMLDCLVGLRYPWYLTGISPVGRLPQNVTQNLADD